MFRAGELVFFKMLMSGRTIEVQVYCEDGMVYLWKNYTDRMGDYEFCYIVSPSTAAEYEKFKNNIEKECPLLLELI